MQVGVNSEPEHRMSVCILPLEHDECRSAATPHLLLFVLFQNIIKKVSGQKFVYKFVSQPDPSLPDGVRNGEEGQRRDAADPNSQSKGLVGVTSTCPSKGLPQVPFFCFCFCRFLWYIDPQ